MAYGGYLIINGQITPGDFTSFVISFFMLNEPVKKLNGFNLKLQEGFAAVRRIFDVLDVEDEIISKTYKSVVADEIVKRVINQLNMI